MQLCCSAVLAAGLTCLAPCYMLHATCSMLQLRGVRPPDEVHGGAERIMVQLRSLMWLSNDAAFMLSCPVRPQRFATVLPRAAGSYRLQATGATGYRLQSP